MKFRYKFSVWTLVLLCLFYTSNAWPQAGTGEINGIVTDSTNAVIDGVVVELTNANTGIVRSTVTNESGIYRFLALPIVGTYSLDVQYPGFKTFKLEGLEVSVGTAVTQDILLEVGAPSDAVTVTAERAAIVRPTESAVSTLIDQNIWQNMPLEVRSQNKFIELVAGAVPDDMAGNTRGAAVNGARGGAGNYMVEGVDNNDQGQGGRGQISTADPGGASTSISPDAIAEYRVITNSFTAEYGKAGGFITDTVLKSGTNAFHGSLFEYNRVQALAANNFFSNANGIEDSLVRNQFGGSFSGPIQKDKAFFFFSTEVHRMRQTEPVHGIGTTREFLDWVDAGGLQQWAESDPDGLCMAYTGEACPGLFSNSDSLGPIFTQLAEKGPFPLATSGFSNTGQGLLTAGLEYPVPVYGDVFIQSPFFANEYRISSKVDYQATNTDHVSFFYLNQTARSGNSYGGGDVDISPAWVQDARGQNAAVTWTHTFSPTVLNVFKVSYLRHRQDYPMMPGYEGMPSVVTAFDPMTVGFGMSVGIPQYFTDNQFQFQDHLAFIKGKHSFKAGWEYRRIRNGSSFHLDESGFYLPYGVEELVTDMAFGDEADLAVFGGPAYGSMYFASASLDPSTGQAPDFYRGYRANELAFYFQDDWRILPRLTVNLGIRYEYFGPPHNFRDDVDSNFYFGTRVTPIVTESNNPYFPVDDPFFAGVATGSFQTRNNEVWNKDTNNFAPRVGFAWDVLGNQKMILRGGAGIMYDRIFNNTFENIRFNPPLFSDNQIGAFVNDNPAGALSTPGLYTYPFSSRELFNSSEYAPTPNPRHMDQNMVSPYYKQFHVGVQWEFLNGYVFEPEYIATLGRKLIGYYDINTFSGRLAGNGYSSERINPNIGADNYRNNNFESDYHALQLTVRKRYSAGLGFNASYTWSRAYDNLSDLFNGRGTDEGPTNVLNPMDDYGLSDYHMRHRFVTTFSYELPFLREHRYLGGWNIHTIITLQSGVPFTPFNSNADLNKDGRYTDRVVYTGSGSPMNSVYDSGSPADGYFDPDMWADYECPADVNDGLWCNSPQPRNSMTGPGYKNVDFGIQKRFKVTETVRMSLQGNFFNFFNHANFDYPEENIAASSFGRSTATFDPRVTQIAIRLDF
ncbi:MAG: TonB-dependent receptor [Acidobacteria bacterium]|nr:TonB-dependent receptor [Acidobacteriota bacterium]